uniref:NADH dehydrogenase [ubiquinone] 1 beta subcomplex subunit 6 n=1 Tax=Malurus cyaneus samueli TaxID=2593467 RepID=A0A8C5UBR0_9PASS
MSGSLGDEKLRVQQLRALRRRWLRDQELSPREPILPPQKLGPVAAFWEGFLKPGGLWRQQVSGGRRVPCGLSRCPLLTVPLPAGAQGVPERPLPDAAGAAPRLGHRLLPEVPRPGTAARCGSDKSTDTPRGHGFRDWRGHATPARRFPPPLMARS